MRKFCTACGNVGHPVLVKKGSTGTAFLLWFFFLLPGIIYSIWRANSEHEACRTCGSPQVIPVDSPMAQKLMGDDYRKMKEADARQLEAHAESVRLAQQAQAVRMAQPWLKRNRAKLIITGVAVIVFCGLIALTVWASYRVNGTAPQQTSVAAPTDVIATPPAVIREPHHKPKQQVEGAAVHETAVTVRDPEPRPQKTETTCEAAGYFWDETHDQCLSHN
jgi:hypothetical protein